jgi:hypothetical protein
VESENLWVIQLNALRSRVNTWKNKTCVSTVKLFSQKL